MADNIDHKQFMEYCENFANKTNTDIALAHYYLQNNDFDLNKAVEDFYLQDHVVVGDFTVPKSERYGLTKLKVLSWNLEGLHAMDRVKRTQTAIEVIKSCKANIILLQELIEETENQIRESLQKDYEIFVDENSRKSYYCGILIKTDKNITVYKESFEVRSFKKSSSGRNLLILKVKINNFELKVMTSHLESTRAFSAERKAQLLEAFQEMQVGDLAIFAGDLNLRDKEITEIGGLPDDVVDIWQSTGQRQEIKYTWDPKRNFNANQLCPNATGLRFDRMYVYERPSDDCVHRLTAVYFELEGLKKVDRGIRYPSDHWAILGHFDV